MGDINFVPDEIWIYEIFTYLSFKDLLTKIVILNGKFFKLVMENEWIVKFHSQKMLGINANPHCAQRIEEFKKKNHPKTNYLEFFRLLQGVKGIGKIGLDLNHVPVFSTDAFNYHNRASFVDLYTSVGSKTAILTCDADMKDIEGEKIRSVQIFLVDAKRLQSSKDIKEAPYEIEVLDKSTCFCVFKEERRCLVFRKHAYSNYRFSGLVYSNVNVIKFREFYKHRLENIAYFHKSSEADLYEIAQRYGVNCSTMLYRVNEIGETMYLTVAIRGDYKRRFYWRFYIHRISNPCRGKCGGKYPDLEDWIDLCNEPEICKANSYSGNEKSSTQILDVCHLKTDFEDGLVICTKKVMMFFDPKKYQEKKKKGWLRIVNLNNDRYLEPGEIVKGSLSIRKGVIFLGVHASVRNERDTEVLQVLVFNTKLTNWFRSGAHSIFSQTIHDFHSEEERFNFYAGLIPYQSANYSLMGRLHFQFFVGRQFDRKNFGFCIIEVAAAPYSPGRKKTYTIHNVHAATENNNLHRMHLMNDAGYLLVLNSRKLCVFDWKLKNVRKVFYSK